MKFFITPLKKHSTGINPLQLHSPLGKLFFDCEIADSHISHIQPSIAYDVDSGGHAVGWYSSDYEIEFLRVNFNPKLPPGMKVEGCVTGIWRLQALKPLKISFSCFLDTHLTHSPETGENLIATTFANSLIRLSIGTEDEEHIKQRALSKTWAPFHISSEIEPNHIQYLSDGIKISLPMLYEKEKLQIHFNVAWTSTKNEDNSTWYAVDQSPLDFD